MSIVAPDFVLVELGNSDSSKNADDRNDNQQFDECETCCAFVGWILLHDHSPLMAGNGAILC